MTLISEKDRGAPEFLWVHITEAATSEFDGGRFVAAAEGWKSAHSVAQGFAKHDPRLAGSLNNLAIAFRINRDFDEAERAYRSALKNWDSAAHWVDRMQLTQRARSSLFHLRMESKHRKQYANIARRKFQELLAAGHAGTLNNLAELFHSTNRLKEAEQYYHQAFRKRIGSMDEQEYGVTVIRKNIARLSDAAAPHPAAAENLHPRSSGAASFLSQAEHHRWVVDRPAEFTDEGRLMAAITLMHILDHRCLCKAKFRNSGI